MTAATTEVLRVEIPDVPGGLAKTVIEPLAEAGVNIEYMYAYSERPSEQAVVVLKVDDLKRRKRDVGVSRGRCGTLLHNLLARSRPATDFHWHDVAPSLLVP